MIGAGGRRAALMGLLGAGSARPPCGPQLSRRHGAGRAAGVPPCGPPAFKHMGAPAGSCRVHWGDWSGGLSPGDPSYTPPENIAPAGLRRRLPDRTTRTTRQLGRPEDSDDRRTRTTWPAASGGRALRPGPEEARSRTARAQRRLGSRAGGGRTSRSPRGRRRRRSLDSDADYVCPNRHTSTQTAPPARPKLRFLSRSDSRARALERARARTRTVGRRHPCRTHSRASSCWRTRTWAGQSEVRDDGQRARPPHGNRCGLAGEAEPVRVGGRSRTGAGWRAKPIRCGLAGEAEPVRVGGRSRSGASWRANPPVQAGQ